MRCVLATHECTVNTGMIEDPCPRCERDEARARVRELETELDAARSRWSELETAYARLLNQNMGLRGCCNEALASVARLRTLTERVHSEMQNNRFMQSARFENLAHKEGRHF